MKPWRHELRLSRPALFTGYVAFGLGLAIAGMVRSARKPRSRIILP